MSKVVRFMNNLHLFFSENYSQMRANTMATTMTRRPVTKKFTLNHQITFLELLIFIHNNHYNFTLGLVLKNQSNKN